ncbi:hypothetical protein L0152_21810 [bacterium]|nr:hypothetical protein [bacterium]
MPYLSPISTDERGHLVRIDDRGRPVRNVGAVNLTAGWKPAIFNAA